MPNERANPCRFDADTIVDRRRMRRKLTFWRVAAALAGAWLRWSAALALAASASTRRSLAAVADRAVKITD